MGAAVVYATSSLRKTCRLDARVSAKSGAACPRGTAYPGFPPHRVRGHPGYTHFSEVIYGGKGIYDAGEGRSRAR
jgi:hypothetical protein